MKTQYLMDTHAFLWSTQSAAVIQLSKTAKTVLEDPESELFVSAVSLYEIAHKYNIRKLSEFADVAQDIYTALEKLTAKELPVTWRHAECAGALDWSHKDPFDRMLAAQAQIENLTLITCDKAFHHAPSVATLW